MCPRSSVAEHFFGKEEVMGPIPIVGSQRHPLGATVRLRDAATDHAVTQKSVEEIFIHGQAAI